ncbi:MAG: peptidoglycan DD-metalloendopeptidase family protein [Proteobacteria bacterium]|nr:peptidoglycan DD-metalloendopeptidase family protein [Pseudomonadota bacterium]
MAAPAPAADTAAKRQELAQLRTRIQALRTELVSAHRTQGELLNSLKTSEQAIGRINQRLRDLDAEAQQHNARLAQLQRDKEQLATEMSAQRHALTAQVRSAYLMGRQDYLKTLLNQQDPARLGRGLLYYNYFNRARAERIAQASAGLEQLTATTQAIEQQRAHLAELRVEQQQEKAVLDDGQQTRELILARLNADIHRKDSQLARLLEDERALGVLLKRLPRAADKQGYLPFAALKGKLPWPAKGNATAPFGSSRLDDRARWQGVLIEGRAGDEVRAVAPGRIAFAEWLRGFGLMIIIDHGDGYMTLYGHNQALYKGVGDRAEAGEVIAAMGASGGNERPGVYFEIREQGVPRDPLVWCRPQELKLGRSN